MTSFKLVASLVLTATAATLSAETRCPGNAASLPLRTVNQHQMIVPVSINHAGPYRFLLDTGTQMTMLDPRLAATLQLSRSGTANVASPGVSTSASFAQVELIEAGSRSAANQKVLVYDLKNLQAGGLDIQGVLGEDFLEQFDMLIDNAHSTLCLNDAGTMQAFVKGQHLALVAPATSGGPDTLAHALIVTARLTDGIRPVRLELDSGADVSFLYNTNNYMGLPPFHSVASSWGGGARGAQRTLTTLPEQEVRIGSVGIGRVTFMTLTGAQKDSGTSAFDGLLAMGLFRRVMIDHADNFAVLEPW